MNPHLPQKNESEQTANSHPHSTLTSDSHAHSSTSEQSDDDGVAVFDASRCSPPGSGSPPVVDISLDDVPVDEDLSPNRDEGQSELRHLIYCFPGHADITLEEAVDMYNTILEDSRLTAAHIEDLATWLTMWSRCTLDKSHWWSEFYDKYRDFWFLLGQLLYKLLTKKYNVYNPPGLQAPLGDVVFNLLEAYVTICTQLAFVDLRALERHAPAPSQFLYEQSQKHLKSLIILFTRLHTTTIWRLAANEDPTSATRRLAEIFLLGSANTTGIHFALASKLAETLESKDGFHDALLDIVLVGGHALHVLLRHSIDSDVSGDQIRACQISGISFVEKTFQELFRVTEKQTAAVNAELAQLFIDALSNTWRFLMMVDHEQLTQALEPWREIAPQASSLEFAEIQRYSVQLTAYRRLLGKGRLEIRVLGAFKMGQALLDLYNFSADPDNEMNQRIRQSTADWVINEKALEQIVSIDSHPSVVCQSTNIMGFLTSTHTWTTSMTDAVFDTICASQDPRMTSAILDTLASAMNFAHLEILKGLCVHAYGLPMDVISYVILSFIQHLTALIFSKDEAPELLAQSLGFLVRLLRYLSIGSKGMGDEESPLKRFAEDMLSRLSASSPSESVKQKICEDCVKDMESMPPTAAASASALDAVLCGERGPRLIDYVVEQLDAATALSDCLVAHINTTRSHSSDSEVNSSFRTLLKLLINLMAYRPHLHLSQDKEARLWQHLVGTDSVSEVYRNEAWHLLSRLCTESVTIHPFVERCIQEYLSEIDPDSFTAGLVEFIQAAISYRMRVHDEIYRQPLTQVPLAEHLWDIIDRCKSEKVASFAASALCDFHVTTDFAKTTPLPEIVKCHESFVDHSVTELEKSGQTIRAVSNESQPLDRDAAYLSFRRTIDCLQKFLGLVPREPRFWVKHQGCDNVRLELFPEPMETDSITLKYQAFPPGGTIEDLTISSSASLHQFYEALQRKTRFAEFRTIGGGRDVELKGITNQLVKSVADKGLFIVKNQYPEQFLQVSSPKIHLNTTAGRAVFLNLERLYDLLSLPNNQSYLIFELLREFAPYSYTSNLLRSRDTNVSSIFNTEEKYKTLYTLHCVLKILSAPASPVAQDSDPLQIICQKIFIALEDVSTASLSLGEPAEEAVTEAYLTCLLQCLKTCRHTETRPFSVARGTGIVSRICKLLEQAKHLDSPHHTTLLRAACESIGRISYLSRDSLGPFLQHEELKSLHQWLLIEQPEPLIRRSGQQCVRAIVGSLLSSEQESDSLVWSEYWDILMSLMPACHEFSRHSQQFLELMKDLIEAYSSKVHSAMNADILNSWLHLLLNRQKSRVGPENLETFVSGLSRLMSVSLSSSELMLRGIDAGYWIKSIFENLLFPPITSMQVIKLENSSANATVLSSEARKHLYQLVGVLCFDKSNILCVNSLMKNLTTKKLGEDIFTWEQDRSLLLRASCGYAGLKNLTNTCYMNSLLSQLFMNPQFTAFILNASIIDSHGSQKLLNATQKLFSAMLGSRRKYADTEDFAYAVKPYDAPVIDVTIQMDVDEFYNLLFEQWEDQVIDKEAKRQFRSIYGGRSVTQIKSLDCNHVSERMEDYLTVSCEVKGKQSLYDSLDAFIAGDSMEGDNKYKCESCGDRYVNAVKRSCLKDVPDHLAFHLKRFDFDILTMQRGKIHDYFSFPQEIDMAPYTYEALSNTTQNVPSDLFDLVGVLVHSGSAEAGHYYSYIRDHREYRADRSSWFEFNDTEVTDFDANKIPDCCFGGIIENEHFRWPKPYCAYMLFYERRNTAASSDRVMQEDILQPRKLSQSPETLSITIAQENDLLIRWYCLMDPEHGMFLRDLMTKVQDMDKSTLHDNHALTVELAAIAIDYLHTTVSKTRNAPEFESIAFSVESLVMECPRCCSAMADRLTLANSAPMSDMLIRCPVQKVRVQVADLVLGLLKAIRKCTDLRKELYGLFRPSEASNRLEFNRHGYFVKVTQGLTSQMEQIPSFCRCWDEYFQLLEKIANLGVDELISLLLTNVLELCMVLIYTSDPPQQQIHPFYEISSRAIGRNRKFANYSPILSLIARLLQHVDTEDVLSVGFDRRADFQGLPEDSLLPVNQGEYQLLHASDSGSYSFLVKCLEATSETEPALSYAAAIVASMLKPSTTKEHLRTVVTTIQRSIDEYYHNYQHLPLTLALPVCEQFPNPEPIRPFFRALRKKGMEFERGAHGSLNMTHAPVDFNPQNGQAILSFLERAADISRPGVEEGEYPLRLLVIQIIPACVTWLLLFDSSKVRDQALQLVRKLLLKHFLDKYESNERESLIIEDSNKVKRLTEFLHQCSIVYALGRKLRVPSATCSQLIAAYEEAMTFLGDMGNKRFPSGKLKSFFDRIDREHLQLVPQLDKVRRDYDRSSSELDAIDDGGGEFEAVSSMSESGGD